MSARPPATYGSPFTTRFFVIILRTSAWNSAGIWYNIPHDAPKQSNKPYCRHHRKARRRIRSAACPGNPHCRNHQRHIRRRADERDGMGVFRRRKDHLRQEARLFQQRRGINKVTLVSFCHYEYQPQYLMLQQLALEKTSHQHCRKRRNRSPKCMRGKQVRMEVVQS